MGDSQSPIDIELVSKGDVGSLLFHYDSALIEGVDIETTLEFPSHLDNWIEFDGVRYRLVQFHFHAPSEHTIDGEYAAIEIHLVHTNEVGEYCVVAVLAEESEMSGWPSSLADSLSLDTLLPGSITRYVYSGSLTTPPYTEGVDWCVLTARITVSPEWADEFRRRYGPNNREIQPLSGRTVTLG